MVESITDEIFKIDLLIPSKSLNILLDNICCNTTDRHSLPKGILFCSHGRNTFV